MKRVLAAAAVATLVTVLSPGGAAVAVAPTTLIVDDDGAQCGNAGYRSIGEAVAAAVPGDAVSVCPGVYRERFDVRKRVRLIGRPGAVGSVKCVDEAWGPGDSVDPRVLPVIEPPDGQVGSLVRLQADGVELTGFVIQAQTDPGLQANIYAPAIQADGANAGHWIHHNLVQRNTLGIELGSSGTLLSRVDHNCLRGNEWAVANQRYTTANVRVDHNEAFRTDVIPFEVGTSMAGISDARFDHNRSVGSGFAAYLVEKAASVSLDHNTVEAPAQGGYGMAVRGENRDVAITDNELFGVPTAAGGISLVAPVPGAPKPSVRIVIDHNTVERFTVGILLGFNAQTTGTQVLHNTTVENRFAGIQIGQSNTAALVQRNVSNNNSYGIRTATPLVTGNTMTGNSMHSNSVFDAVESSLTTDGVATLNNSWVDNSCDTDSPTDSICVD